MSPRLLLDAAWASLCAPLLPLAARRAVASSPSWPGRWEHLRGLRDRARLPWTDEQMEAALAKAGAGKGEAR